MLGTIQLSQRNAAAEVAAMGACLTAINGRRKEAVLATKLAKVLELRYICVLQPQHHQDANVCGLLIVKTMLRRSTKKR
jgi:hypothetical protein